MAMSSSPSSGLSLRNSQLPWLMEGKCVGGSQANEPKQEFIGPISGNVYRICEDKILGEGTYGCVKLARVDQNLLSGGQCEGRGISVDQKHGGTMGDDFYVAVKILNKKMIRIMDLEDFVARERDIHMQLTHRGRQGGTRGIVRNQGQGDFDQSKERGHVARLFDVVETAEQIMFFVEYCPRGSLSKIHFAEEFHEPVPEDLVRQYMKQLILGSMDLLHHQNNIVHRDIQLDNICLDQSGHIALIDFGMADRYEPDEPGSTRSHVPLIAGNRAYMAPELLFHSMIPCDNPEEELPCGEMDDVGDSDFASAMNKLTIGEMMQKQDLWSIGVCLFYLATGFLPFQNQHLRSVPVRPLTQKELNDMISKLFELPDWLDDEPISEECKDFIRNLLTINPSKRLTLAQAQRHRWLNMNE